MKIADVVGIAEASEPRQPPELYLVFHLLRCVSLLRFFGTEGDRSAIALEFVICGLLHMEGVVVYSCHPDDFGAWRRRIRLAVVLLLGRSLRSRTRSASHVHRNFCSSRVHQSAGLAFLLAARDRALGQADGAVPRLCAAVREIRADAGI